MLFSLLSLKCQGKDIPGWGLKNKKKYKGDSCHPLITLKTKVNVKFLKVQKKAKWFWHKQRFLGQKSLTRKEKLIQFCFWKVTIMSKYIVAKKYMTNSDDFAKNFCKSIIRQSTQQKTGKRFEQVLHEGRYVNSYCQIKITWDVTFLVVTERLKLSSRKCWCELGAVGTLTLLVEL